MTIASQLYLPIAFKNFHLARNTTQMVLAGDIGGTKANMLLCLFTAAGIEVIKEERFVSKDHDSFTSIISKFLDGQPSPAKICLSVAGPVIQGRVKFTNLTWQIDSAEISALFSCPVAILNDLEATAYGLAATQPGELGLIQKGESMGSGNIAIIAAGTGLGEAGLFFDGQNYHPFATEGGHCDFAPRNDQDIAVLNFLRKRHQRVSWERLLSGTGIFTIWEFLTEIEHKPVPGWLAEQILHNDKPAMISKAAIEKTCPVCMEAMDMFNRYLAIEGANMILKLKATGGLYLAGGIAAKNISLLDPAVWQDMFQKSGRMKALLAQVPVYVMTNEKAPLLGSAYYAAFNM
ncbi:MAG: glucokinase [Bacteroidota bacterium]